VTRRTQEDRDAVLKPHKPSGRRRTSAEPLAASWDPKVDAEARISAKSSRSGRQGARPTKALLTYALPLLVVLTVVVAFDVTRPSGNNANAFGGTASQQPNAGSNGTTSPPVVGEAPLGGKADLNLPAAELPAGGAYTEQGAGQWHTVPGTVPAYGGGPTKYTYTVEVENGIDASSFAGEDGFARMVDATLQDSRSWIGSSQLTLERIDQGTPNIRISLTTPNTARRADMCGYSIRYESSCYRPGNAGSYDHRVIINLARWTRGALSYAGDLGSYRQYAINHEVGHFLGQIHVGCTNSGTLAPVMMQQTFGVNNDFVWQLNQADSSNKTAVAHDGKTCQPNPWPNPSGRPY
jgi:hypothetical protein